MNAYFPMSLHCFSATSMDFFRGSFEIIARLLNTDLKTGPTFYLVTVKISHYSLLEYRCKLFFNMVMNLAALVCS